MNCHLCSKEIRPFYSKNKNIIFYHCKSCEFFLKSSKDYQDLKIQKIRYDLHDNTHDNQGYIQYFRRFIDFILPYIGKPKKTLDFGCGATTLLSSMLENKGIPCDYYDPIYYPNTLDHNKKYDLIVSTEVFEHLHNPKEVFKSLIERLEEGGYLAIQTQFHSNDTETFKTWYYHKDPTHIVFFRQKSFQVLATMYGCTIVTDNGKNMILIQKIN